MAGARARGRCSSACGGDRNCREPRLLHVARPLVTAACAARVGAVSCDRVAQHFSSSCSWLHSFKFTCTRRRQSTMPLLRYQIPGSGLLPALSPSNAASHRMYFQCPSRRRYTAPASALDFQVGWASSSSWGCFTAQHRASSSSAQLLPSAHVAPEISTTALAL